MGATYYVISASLADRYPWAADSLKRHGMFRLMTPESGRNPTPRELREVLDDLSGYTVDYLVSKDNWQADIRAKKGVPLFRPTALLNVIDYHGDETTPHLICFEKGDPRFNILIVERLSRICGLLFIIPDTGAQPLAVTPGVDPTDAMKVWKMG